MRCIGVSISPVWTSWRTRWRCEKVPRSVSWPVSLTGTPSTSSDAKASASAWPQSIPPSSSAARRRSSWLASFGLTVKPSGRLQQLLRQPAQPLLTNACLDRGGAGADDRLLVRLGRDLAAEGRLQPLVRLAHPPFRLRRECLGLLGREHALGDEPGTVQLAHRRMVRDLLGHQRLRVGRLVLLVVAETPVTDEIDDHVVAEAAAIRQCEPDRGDRRLRVVRVHVDDRRVEALREIGRVARRAGLCRVGREADLVVRDHVQGAAGRIARERVEVERLRDDPLAGERRIAVEQHRHRERRVVRAVPRAAIGLHRAGAALDDGIDRFEVAWVRGKRDLDLAGRGDAGAARAEVVLHVAGAALAVLDERRRSSSRPRTRAGSSRRRRRSCERAR